MTMSDTQIQHALARGYITITPTVDNPDYVRWQPASVDLTLGAGFQELLPDAVASTDLSRPQPMVFDDYLPPDIPDQFWVRPLNGINIGDPSVWRSAHKNRTWINPGEFLLASTAEIITLSDRVAGIVAGKSSGARSGLQVESAGFIDPGFSGTITLELYNFIGRPIYLTPGMPICQIVFSWLEHPARRPYGSQGLNSHYRSQHGPTPADWRSDGAD